MSLIQSEQVFLDGNDLLHPKDGTYYIQIGSDYGNVIFKTDFIPKRICMFAIQTNSSGIYLLNNSTCKYRGDRFLTPNKIHLFNINYDNGWIITTDRSVPTGIVSEWSLFFYSSLAAPPPLSARRYALFINAIYNELLLHKQLVDEAVFNEAARKACLVLHPTVNSDSVYNKYEKLSTENTDIIVSEVQNFLSAHPIPSNATSPSYVLPAEEKTKWNGTNPILPNWKPENISYLVNTFTQVQHDPSTTMESDAKEFTETKRNAETNEIAVHFANTSPPMHLTYIALSSLSNMSPLELTKVLSFMSICVADAGLFAWNVKYTYWGARPFQYITGFTPVITTPNFPGYISGHSTFSAAWAQSLALVCPNLKGITKYIAELSGISRIYGGIHFEDDNVTGLFCGSEISKSVYEALATRLKSGQSLLQ